MPKTNAARNDMVSRDTILKMLSDDEVASVCTAETRPGLTLGSVYIELDHLDRGLQKATPGLMAMGEILPEKSVQKKTWKQIEAVLSSVAPPPRPR